MGARGRFGMPGPSPSTAPVIGCITISWMPSSATSVPSWGWRERSLPRPGRRLLARDRVRRHHHGDPDGPARLSVAVTELGADGGRGESYHQPYSADAVRGRGAAPDRREPATDTGAPGARARVHTADAGGRPHPRALRRRLATTARRLWRDRAGVPDGRLHATRARAGGDGDVARGHRERRARAARPGGPSRRGPDDRRREPFAAASRPLGDTEDEVECLSGGHGAVLVAERAIDGPLRRGDLGGPVAPIRVGSAVVGRVCPARHVLEAALGLATAVAREKLRQDLRPGAGVVGDVPFETLQVEESAPHAAIHLHDPDVAARGEQEGHLAVLTDELP